MADFRALWRAALPLALASCTLATPTARSAGSVGACPLLPGDNVWNAPITSLPLDGRSAAYVTSIGSSAALKADFGAGLYEGQPIGIPYTTVSAGQALVNILFGEPDESDPGPYPIPANAPIEGGPTADGDRHVLVVDQSSCTLYELYYAFPQPDGSWQASSGARYDLRSNALRPATWTSADAAGLPILPGLVRYDEVAAGAITHAIRFTAPQTQRAFIWPARHQASSLTDPNLPPMGQRFRLRASYDISGFSAANRVILTALKTYGLILADNGSAWFMSGAPDDRWDNDDLQRLRTLHGSDFEAIDEQSLQINPDSGQAHLFTPTAFVSLPLVVR